MSSQVTQSYQLDKDLSVRKSKLETACVVNEEIDQNLFHIIWIKDGKGSYNIDFQKLEVEGNTLFFLNPGQIFHIDSEQVSEAYQIGFSQDFHCVEKHNSDIACNGILFNTPGELPAVQIPLEKVEIFEGLFQNIFREFEKNDAGKEDMLKIYLRMILVEATRIKAKQEKVRSSELSTEQRLVSQFNTLVERNYKRYHKVSDYARMIGITPKSIAKQFKKLNKSTPGEIIRDRIILEAKRLLKYTDKSTKEISFELGFEDPAYFSRMFKKNTLTSPVEFRSS